MPLKSGSEAPGRGPEGKRAESLKCYSVSPPVSFRDSWTHPPSEYAPFLCHFSPSWVEKPPLSHLLAQGLRAKASCPSSSGDQGAGPDRKCKWVTRAMHWEL